MNVFEAGLTAEASHGSTLDHYGSSWRTTLLQAAGAGTYSEWSLGEPDWRARSMMQGTGTLTNAVQTNTSNKKVSYLMEPMISRGITGNVGTVLVGIYAGGSLTGVEPFIRRNGVETPLTSLVLSSDVFRWCRVANAGWSPTDIIEVGLKSGSTSTISLYSLGLIVKHDTPEPAPLTDTGVSVVAVDYVGNGTAQTIDLGNNLMPTAVFIVPKLLASSFTPPTWWWDSRLGAAPFNDSLTSFARLWPNKGKVHVIHKAATASYNASGVSYQLIALFDPSGRFVIPFAVSKSSADDNYTHYLHYPQSGEPATDFTPDFVFGGAVFGPGNGEATRASLYRGPAHAAVGDLAAKLGALQASDADRIQATGAGTVQFGTTVESTKGDQAFWAGRVSDGVSSTRLMAVTSYVGNGSASRNIALSLNGATPTFVLVVPTTGNNKGYRVDGDTTGRLTHSGGSFANSITGMAADQITVGTALNAVGVTYDVWAIRPGTVAP
jgi:hypothetical protein